LNLLKVFILALLISFVGSLPLGSVNVTAFQLSLSSGISAATWFVTGSLLAETIYVRLTLALMDRIMTYKSFLKILHLISLLVLVALAIISFLAAGKSMDEISSPIIPSGIHPFIPGLIMMGINPVQIPFWAGWSTVLFEKKLLKPRASHYNVFTLGASLGAMAASILFIYAGQLMTSTENTSLKTINISVGCLFLVMAGVQGYRMIKPKT